MLYQCNIFVSIAIAAFATIYLLHYVIVNNETIFFWSRHCQNDFKCHEVYFSGPPHPLKDTDLMATIKEQYLVPPPKYPNKTDFDIYAPVWRKLVDWYKVQESLIEIFRDKPPGFFVEVGAVDGEFMSQTLYLERKYGWTGLLVEPDPRSFANLIKMKRNAWLSPICVKIGYPSSVRYWLRRIEVDLPHHFQQLLMARSKLETEILEGDEERGTSVSVPSAPLSTVLLALQVPTIDLLTIDTGGEDDFAKIKDVARGKSFDVKVLLIHYTTTKLYEEPFPKISGFIVDVKRSQLLVKIYIKAKYCELVETESCEAVETFSVTRACFLYNCLGNLRVKSSHLVSTKRNFTS